jgi:hypothetical protein
VIHWCAKHCITLVWQDGHYTNAKEPGTSEWLLDSFTKESFVMRRTDYQLKTGTAIIGGKAVLSGRISEQGNSVADGKITWTYHPCCGTGTSPFTAAWGAALESVPGSDQDRDRAVQVPAQDQSEICQSLKARLAMQSLEIKTLSDPSVVGLRVLGIAVMGVDMSAGPATLVASQVGTNVDSFTAGDPGSFVCAGLFVQSDLHFKGVTEDAEGVAELSEKTINALLATHRAFPLYFKVKHLEGNRYNLTLLQTTTKLSNQYSAEFTHK